MIWINFHAIILDQRFIHHESWLSYESDMISRSLVNMVSYLLREKEKIFDLLCNNENGPDIACSVAKYSIRFEFRILEWNLLIWQISFYHSDEWQSVERWREPLIVSGGQNSWWIRVEDRQMDALDDTQTQVLVEGYWSTEKRIMNRTRQKRLISILMLKKISQKSPQLDLEWTFHSLSMLSPVHESDCSQIKLKYN